MSTTTVESSRAGGVTRRPRERVVPEPIPTSRLLAVELRKMFNTRAGFWLMASIAILSVIATVVTIIFAPDSELNYEAFASAIGFPMSVILPMIAVLSVSSEWSQRSALTTFTLVPSGSRVIAAKAGGAVALGVAAMLIALGVGALGNIAGSAIAGIDTTWNVEAWEFGQIVLADQIGMLMGFMLGVLFRSSPAAIVGYFVYALVLPTISGTLASVHDWRSEHAAWLDLNWASMQLFESKLTGEMWAQLALTSTVWLVLPLAIGLRALLRSEVK